MPGSAKYQIAAQLRALARSAYEQSGAPRVCKNCGYAKHVEICHIKAISSFPPETLVEVVNDAANLVALCPNCHWEFDHGMLTL
ncbi:MAG: HNH endonuclease [Anaerolineae bacterium]